MSYDNWKTRDPNHGIGDHDHCSTCGAHYTEPCQAQTPCGYEPVREWAHVTPAAPPTCRRCDADLGNSDAELCPDCSL